MRMSVVIKGMDVPKNERYVDVRIFADGRATTATGERPFYREMDVIELPPHGRLVDADALFFTDFTLAQIALEKGNPFKNLAIAIFEKIETAPTILEAEVENASS